MIELFKIIVGVSEGILPAIYLIPGTYFLLGYTHQWLFVAFYGTHALLRVYPVPPLPQAEKGNTLILLVKRQKIKHQRKISYTPHCHSWKNQL